LKTSEGEAEEAEEEQGQRFGDCGRRQRGPDSRRLIFTRWTDRPWLKNDGG